MGSLTPVTGIPDETLQKIYAEVNYWHPDYWEFIKNRLDKGNKQTSSELTAYIIPNMIVKLFQMALDYDFGGYTYKMTSEIRPGSVIGSSKSTLAMHTNYNEKIM